MKRKLINFKKGSMLAEILVAVFVFSVILGSLITASNLYLTSASTNLKIAKGAYLAEEGIEAVKLIRDAGWNNISSLNNDTDYYLVFDNSTSVWATTTTPNSIDSFVRKFNLSAVNRDVNGRIVLFGGSLDPNTKKMTVSVSWNEKGSTTTKSISSYIANVIGN